MVTQNFDTLFPADLTGTITSILVKDQDATPNHVLERNTPWGVQIEWQVAGNNAHALGGQWRVQLKLESLGGGFEGNVGEDTKAYTNVEAGSNLILRKWKMNFQNLPDPLPAGEEGVYRLVVLITYKDVLGLPCAMAGAIEGPLITFYIAGP